MGLEAEIGGGDGVRGETMMVEHRVMTDEVDEEQQGGVGKTVMTTTA